MRSRKVSRTAGLELPGLLGWLVILATVSMAAGRDGAPTVVGTVVEVRPDTEAILLDVDSSDARADLLRFQLADSTRIRVNGGFGRLADVVAGQTARITYVRADGANLVELVEVTDAPPASTRVEAAREARGIESRRRYLEETGRTLDVLEESVGELRQHPDVQGTDELERLDEAVEALEMKLTDARVLHSALSATASQEPWRRGVDLLSAAIDDLSIALEQARSDVSNR
jgi:hypothetical protein